MSLVLADFYATPVAPGGSGGPPSGAAGGDLEGTYPNPTVVAGALTGADIDSPHLGTTPPYELPAGTAESQLLALIDNIGAVATGFYGDVASLQGVDAVHQSDIDALNGALGGFNTRITSLENDDVAQAANLSDLASIPTARVNLGIPILVTFHVPGVLVAGAVPQRHYLEDILPGGNTWTIQKIRAAAWTAPTGADLIIDVNLNAVTIFTTQGNRPTIAAGTNDDLVDNPDVTAVAALDYLTIEVDQVGSGVAGADLIVNVWLTVA